MSVVATQNTKVSDETETGVVKNWKNPVIYTVLALLSVFLIGVRAPEKTISLGISDGVRWFQAEPLQINPQVYGWIAVVIMLALAAYALVTTNTGKLLGRPQ